MAFRAAAGLLCARTSIAIERFRLAEGRMPGTLEEMVPAYLNEDPLDPIDGSPLRYVDDDVSYVVYSIGTNGVDDGGKIDDRHKGDIRFYVLK